MKYIFFLSLLLISGVAMAQQPTVFETSNGKATATYPQAIAYYQGLAVAYPNITIEAIGSTDSGYPLHLVMVSNDGKLSYEQAHEQGKTVILINNGIHPGEPDGIESCMMLARDYASKAKALPDNVVLAIIPIYNIGGALNRNSHSRTNQEGPLAYGFRGNAQNLDLNRDFIKMDSRNAKTFAQIYHKVNPEILIDTHVSNGADYQYSITHLATQPDKLGGALGSYLNDTMIPALEKGMAARNNEIVPYVNVFSTTPDKAGYNQFMDSPRYSSGYTALFSSIGFTIETHMLKPFDVRVNATTAFIESVVAIAAKDGSRIKSMRNAQLAQSRIGTEMPVNWALDKETHVMLNFKGYEGEMITSKVTGQPRLSYNRDKPFEKEIPYYNHYKPSQTVIAPKAYIIPRGWNKAIERLKLNNVAMTPLKDDTVMQVEVYRIEKYNTAQRPYEGHYPHNSVMVSQSTAEQRFLKGDYYISLDQQAAQYLVAVLEPSAVDSYFVWNFFDTILQQKEHFSPYVFEDLADKMLKGDKTLKALFEKEKAENEAFASNWYLQLDFLYKHSPHYEKAHLKYPVYRVVE